MANHRRAIPKPLKGGLREKPAPTLRRYRARASSLAASRTPWMEPKEVKTALAPHPSLAHRLRAVRDEGPPERISSREAERIFSFVTVMGLAIIDVPKQFCTKVEKVAVVSKGFWA
jgi:hypothetical protein